MLWRQWRGAFSVCCIRDNTAWRLEKCLAVTIRYISRPCGPPLLSIRRQQGHGFCLKIRTGYRILSRLRFGVISVQGYSGYVRGFIFCKS